MKKLYECTLTLYVVAEDEDEAKHAAYYGASYSDHLVWEVNETESCSHDWWNSLPFGDDSDKTCGQWVADIREAKVAAQKQALQDELQMQLEGVDNAG